MLYTIIQIIAFQALFLVVYDFFLKRETFFNYNRAYLLLTAVLSLILPFLKLPELKTMTADHLVIQLPEVFIGAKIPSTTEVFIAEQAGLILEKPVTPIWQILALAGMGIAALVFLLKILRLYWLKHHNPKRWRGNVLIVHLLQSSAAFSFFNTIFLGERIPETDRSTILKHELVHIKDGHSLDLIFFELLRIAMWFNPLVYIYQRRIKELHEYIADAKAVKENGKSEYYQSLLSQVFDVSNVSFTNTFFKKSLLKKRIAMLQKTKSRPTQLLKYALLIPLLFVMLVYTSTEVRAQKILEPQTDTFTQQLSDENQINLYYDEIVALDNKNSETYFKIRDLYDYSSRKYIPTKDEYLRYVAYKRFMGKKFKLYSSNRDSVSLRQLQRFERMMSLNDTYDDYLNYLKTEEAQQQRKNIESNRTLQIISEDIDNLTKEQHKDAYEKVDDIFNGQLYKRLLIKDDEETVEITKINYDALIRFFSKDELKALLSQIKTENPIEHKGTTEVHFSEIDKAPTLMECKDLLLNSERKACLSEYINNHVNRTFNTKLSDSLDPGTKRVFVQFKIDTSGYVTNIQARGPSELLEDEAVRVIKTLPQFDPGKQGDTLVIVPFSMPIVFVVANEEKNASPIQLNSGKNLVAVEDRNDVIPFAVVDLPPAYEGCGQITDPDKLRTCTSNAILMYINRNFNLKVAEQLEIIGRQKIFCLFTINYKGEVVKITARAQHPELEAEAIRVITEMPRFIPGQDDGNIVSVSFSIPIVFEIASPKKN